MGGQSRIGAGGLTMRVKVVQLRQWGLQCPSADVRQPPADSFIFQEFVTGVGHNFLVNRLCIW